MQIVLPIWTFFDPRNQEKKLVQLSEEGTQQKEEQEKPILCATCNHKITTHEEGISMNGAHIHEFTNPQSIRFRIGCFQSSFGCVREGEPTSEWTWFAGYDWCIANCAQCVTHLGWHYQNHTNNEFYGLILSRLREAVTH